MEINPIDTVEPEIPSIHVLVVFFCKSSKHLIFKFLTVLFYYFNIYILAELDGILFNKHVETIEMF